MTSLADVYEETGPALPRRVYLGGSLFLAGAVLVVVGIVIGTTDVLSLLGVGTLGSRQLAGLLAGLGVPSVFVGIFTVLPAHPHERATAAIGASIAVFGVLLFWHAYPTQWVGATPNHLTLPVVTVYFLGTIVTFWSLFAAVVKFKTRNDPGGTVTLQRIFEGKTRFVEVPASNHEARGQQASSNAMGTVGVVGDVDRSTVMESKVEEDDDVEITTASDGGIAPGTPQQSIPDRYCGNCLSFEYVRGDAGMQPYCGFHDEVMEDVEACEDWRSNTPRTPTN